MYKINTAAGYISQGDMHGSRFNLNPCLTKGLHLEKSTGHSLGQVTCPGKCRTPRARVTCPGQAVHASGCTWGPWEVLLRTPRARVRPQASLLRHASGCLGPGDLHQGAPATCEGPWEVLLSPPRARVRPQAVLLLHASGDLGVAPGRTCNMRGSLGSVT